MDTQSIGSVGGAQVASTDPNNQQPQSATKAAQATTTVAATDANVDKKTDTAVRVRDPRSLQFQFDKSTNQVVTTIIDDRNQTVVMQIPNEEMLRIAKAIDRMQGFLVESKA